MSEASFSSFQQQAEQLHDALSPLDTFGGQQYHESGALPADVDMSTAASTFTTHSAGLNSFVNPNDISQRSRSADVPYYQHSHNQDADYYLDGTSGDRLHPGMNFGGTDSVPSLSPINLGPGHSNSESPASESHYPPTPQSVVQQNSFQFPVTGSPTDSFQPQDGVSPYNTRSASNRHKPQRSLSTGELPRGFFSQPIARNNSVHGGVTLPASTPQLAAGPANSIQVPMKATSLGAGAFVYKVYKLV